MSSILPKVKRRFRQLCRAEARRLGLDPMQGEFAAQSVIERSLRSLRREQAAQLDPDEYIAELLEQAVELLHRVARGEIEQLNEVLTITQLFDLCAADITTAPIAVLRLRLLLCTIFNEARPVRGGERATFDGTSAATGLARPRRP